MLNLKLICDSSKTLRNFDIITEFGKHVSETLAKSTYMAHDSHRSIHAYDDKYYIQGPPGVVSLVEKGKPSA
jgi:hypothetical protein